MPAEKRERTEELKARHREEQQRYLQRHGARNKDRINAAKRAWKERNAEKVREYNRKRRATEKGREAKAAENRRYRAAHSAAVKTYNRAYYCRKISIMQVRTSPDEVYRRAIAALPSGLPRFIRDDVVSSLCLAILEGEINVNDMAAQAKVYLRAYNREYDTFQTVSLDKFIPGTKTTYLDALVAA
ncbi:hypothetical protein ACG873_30305 [Mesorhizobium sp. AaZ16]|uniref:hypothetical protein n=1 Tax=Mesorhizobium sp. AaZ16 TaxID=3402289 RepID=UPI00374EA813